MSSRISQKFFEVLFSVAFVFEPLAPRAITYIVTRRLKEWKKRGLISEFKTRTRRLGKFHYRIEIGLDVTSNQALHVLSNMQNQLKSVRRWLNV